MGSIIRVGSFVLPFICSIVSLDYPHANAKTIGRIFFAINWLLLEFHPTFSKILYMQAIEQFASVLSSRECNL